MAQNETAVFTSLAYPAGYDNTQRTFIARGTVTFPAEGSPATQNFYPAGGFSLSSVYDAEQIKSLPASSTTGPLPFAGFAVSVANPPSGYLYFFDNVNWNLHVYEAVLSGSPPSPAIQELAAGSTLPAGVASDTVLVTLEFVRN